MTPITCLLVTDDPDHQLQFSEALDEVTESVILLTVAKARQAFDLLDLGLLAPNFIFLDSTMENIDIADLIQAIKSKSALDETSLTVLTYRKEKEIIDNHVTYFSPDYSYFELREFLRRLINP